MFGVDIDVFPPDVDGVVVDMIGVYVLEVVVVDAIGADVEVDVFDSVEIVWGVMVPRVYCISASCTSDRGRLGM